MIKLKQKQENIKYKQKNGVRKTVNLLTFFNFLFILLN